MSNSLKVSLLVIGLILLDQILKIWVKTNMEYNQEIAILGLSWAKLHFVENNGMAFGLSMSGEYGKLLLSLFRILAVTALFYFIKHLISNKAPTTMVLGFGLILAGAIGNIIDSAFYGIIFSDSHFHGGIAEIFPADGNTYSGFLHGKVVDMLYFPFFQGRLPEWFPFWSNRHVVFLRPVFNIADLGITLGVLNTIIFHRGFFQSENIEKGENTQIIEIGESDTAKNST